LCLAPAIAALATFLPAAQALAQTGPDLNVSPKRIVFSPDLRTATVNVFNRGDAPATYTIGLIDRVMTPDGQIRAVDDPDLKTADPSAITKMASAKEMITFTPRRVTLRPGQSQVIRLRVDRPADLKGLEYHTHLTITALPPDTAGETAEEAAAGANALVTKIATQFSIAIAVIVRNGAANVAGGLENVKYSVRPAAADAPAVGALSMDLLRKGPNSLYGDVEVRDSKAARNAPPIGLVRGIGVYNEVDHRSIDVVLTKIPARGDRLEIVFKDDDSKPGAVLASTAFTVP
jgi:P pilus assembly chaperone PapD